MSLALTTDGWQQRDKLLALRRAELTVLLNQVEPEDLAALERVAEIVAAASAQAVLKTEGEQQCRTTDAAEQALALLMRRYKDYADTYLQVVISQTVALQNERNEIDIRRRQMAASVLFMKPLGGAGILPNFQPVDTSNGSTA